ncbi:hypothetical protein ACLBWS_15110 [Brucellaceae bacterium D45D]
MKPIYLFLFIFIFSTPSLAQKLQSYADSAQAVAAGFIKFADSDVAILADGDDVSNPIIIRDIIHNSIKKYHASGQGLNIIDPTENIVYRIILNIYKWSDFIDKNRIALKFKKNGDEFKTVKCYETSLDSDGIISYVIDYEEGDETTLLNFNPYGEETNIEDCN